MTSLRCPRPRDLGASSQPTAQPLDVSFNHDRYKAVFRSSLMHLRWLPNRRLALRKPVFDPVVTRYDGGSLHHREDLPTDSFVATDHPSGVKSDAGGRHVLALNQRSNTESDAAVLAHRSRGIWHK